MEYFVQDELRDIYTFENFVVGPQNLAAYSAAVAVAEDKKQRKPLILFGPSGIGKTYLLWAIGAAAKRAQPDKHVVYVKTDQITAELIQAIQKKEIEAFRKKYTSSDILLVDDFQHIAGKSATQEEFLLIFRMLRERGRQIVITINKDPKNTSLWEGLFADGVDSFEFVGIDLLDHETRTKIIRLRAVQWGLPLSEDSVGWIADNTSPNVRALEGALKKILAYRDLLETEPNFENVKKILAAENEEPKT